MYINQSLTYLEQCVVALSKRGNAHIPYRQTKLTSVLKVCVCVNFASIGMGGGANQAATI
jgi:kinesin family protein 6/9